MVQWVGERVGRVFSAQPDRVAAAWRRARWSTMYRRAFDCNALDDVVESFIRQLGAALEGVPGAVWSRTRGVLRLSRVRGARALADEFEVLRSCLVDAADAMGGTRREREVIRAA